MKKFFSEFKKFITRGNVMDLAVGVIIGGAFISAILNFLIIAFVLFLIVKTINKVNEGVNELVNGNGVFTKKEIRQFRRKGLTTKEIRVLEQDKIAADKKAEEDRLAEEAKNAPPTQEQLLTQILDELKKRNEKAE